MADPLRVVIVTTFDTSTAPACVQAIGRGRTNTEVAGDLFISLITVK